MVHNLVTLVPSPFHEQESVIYQSEDGFSASCSQAAEAGLRYIIWKLAQQKEKVAAVYPFVTANVEEAGGLEKFKALFDKDAVSFVEVPLADDGQFQNIVPSLLTMSDLVKNFLQQHPGDTVRMHVDMTGGQCHIPLVMLSLLQLLKYQGVKTGLLIYTDLGQQQVADASPFLSLGNLVSGAEEFTAYGSTRGLQEYFATQNKPSGELSFLLRRMNQVADTLRLCGNYEGTEAALKDLALAIQRYETYAAGKKITLQDCLFGKLLPQVEKEYSQILPRQKEINPADIITWCVRKGFLQQAMTFYAEWLPRYLVQAGYITLKDPNIKKECEKRGQAWSSWEIYFVKEYRPEDSEIEGDEADNGELTYKRLRQLLEGQESLTMVGEKIMGKNKTIDELLTEARIIQSFDISRAVSYVLNLPKLSPLSVFFRLSCPHDVPSYASYVRKCFEKERNNIRAILTKGIALLGKTKMEENFQLAADGLNNKDKSQQRKEVFQWLFEHHKIASTLPQEQICGFAANYIKRVSKWRNAFNHADTRCEANEESQNLLIQDVAFLTHKASSGEDECIY